MPDPEMPRPAEPHYSFTIPSIHDDTTLDCRIYHPKALSTTILLQWEKRGIVMAHPYAPMGGSYDDRIVGIVVDEFLRAGWVVGTFNFRGAHGSKGRTSWTGRPELDDYVSFSALFIHYMHHLRPHPVAHSSPIQEQPPILRPSAPQEGDLASTVILGGYSYGSLILKNLPPMPTILQPFSAPVLGSAADEVISRAIKLADETNLEWELIAQRREQEQESIFKGHIPKHPLTMGGDETSPDKRRSSRDIRRSVDGRLGTEVGNRLRSLSHRGRKHDTATTPVERKEHAPLTFPNVWYLLVSPLNGPIATLAAPSLAGKLWSRKDESEECIGKYPTLAIYGDQDIFTSTKKTREWVQRLSTVPGSRFSSVEVTGAGHFWVEQGVEAELRTALKEWQMTSR